MLAGGTFVPPNPVEDYCIHSIGDSVVRDQEWNPNRNLDVAQHLRRSAFPNRQSPSRRWIRVFPFGVALAFSCLPRA